MADEQRGKRGRPYQVDLVHYAMKENTIVNLGTGAGKTFVAVMLIREFSSQTKETFTNEQGQRTVFLAHTVPLVKQQADYIRDNTNLVVSDFCGDSNSDWSKEKWYQHFNANNVLVFSRVIFLNLLQKSFIKPRQINLMIFDECHHATKNDPFVQIMNVIKDAPEHERPRILGLSASLLGQKVKPGELESGIKGLESILMCRARTAPDLTEVIKYATNPTEKIVKYSNLCGPVENQLKHILTSPLKFLHHQKRNGKLEEIAENVLHNLLNILVELGPASASEFVTESIKEMNQSIVKYQLRDQWEKMIGCLVLSHLTIFNSKCTKLKQELQDSNKVCTLLSEIALNIKQTHELRAIIFTDKRHTASCLAKLIQSKSQTDLNLKHIKCCFVVGHNIGQNVKSMKSKEQDKILSCFRKGKINLLIATSVIEEGIDVPRCNLVIRFDLPQTFRSYVQSKGRARDKPSTFVLLVNEETQSINDITDYHILEKELISVCQSDRKLPTEHEIQEKMSDKISPYMPNGENGAKATVENSLSLLQKYCQQLPHDEYTVLVPHFSVFKISKYGDVSEELSTELEEEEDPNFDFISYLTLPINCPIKKIIESPPLDSKLQSQRAAALYAVKELHKTHEIDDTFKPVPSFDSDDEDVQQEKAILLAGTEKRSQFYKSKISSALVNCQPQGDTLNYLYVFEIRNEKTNDLYNANEGLGILMNKPINYWKIPIYSLYHKSHLHSDDEIELTVSVKQFPINSQLTSRDIETLKNCHHKIFSNVICIQPPVLLLDFDKADKNYVVVPVIIEKCNKTNIIEVSINLEIASTIANHISDKYPPDSSEKYDNAIVTAAHRDSTTHSGLLQLFHAQLDSSITPLSPFPDLEKYSTFFDYYKTKHQFELSDLNQPALKCTHISLSFLKYFRRRFDQRPPSNKKNSIKMFPQLVHLYPVPATLLMLIRFLPAILWRLESLLLAEEFSTVVAAETDIGSLDCNTKLITNTTLKGYVDAGFGNLPSQVIKYSPQVVPEITHVPFTYQISNRGPDNCLILQALTPTAANDSINLERLELLGDSLLKLVTTVYLFITRPMHHEGKLSEARAHRVSNISLFCLGKKKSIETIILSKDFNMGAGSSNVYDRVNWLPPGYISQVPCYTQHCVSDKCIADCVEALIGAYTVSGGLNGGLSFIKWLGVKLYCREDTGPVSSVTNSNNILFCNSSSVFKRYLGTPYLPSMPPTDTDVINHMLSQVAIVQKVISYQFHNQLLLIEAMTHMSYSHNNITDCYQRLEFLGDAILDYLVTCQIYSSDSLCQPGHMTELRSAVVCNIQLAELAVSLELHKSLLHHSPSLFTSIRTYVAALNERNDPLQMDIEQLSIFEEDDYEYDDDLEDLYDHPKCLSDCFEALAGAVFVDSDMSLEVVWNTFKPFLKPLLDKFHDDIPTNPAKELHERFPNKVKVKKRNIQNQSFLCTIEIDGTDVRESAISKSYKNSKNIAAAKVLQKLDTQKVKSKN